MGYSHSLKLREVAVAEIGPGRPAERCQEGEHLHVAVDDNGVDVALHGLKLARAAQRSAVETRSSGETSQSGKVWERKRRAQPSRQTMSYHAQPCHMTTFNVAQHATTSHHVPSSIKSCWWLYWRAIVWYHVLTWFPSCAARFLSGKCFMLQSLTSAGSWKPIYDVQGPTVVPQGRGTSRIHLSSSKLGSRVRCDAAGDHEQLVGVDLRSGLVVVVEELPEEVGLARPLSRWPSLPDRDPWRLEPRQSKIRVWKAAVKRVLHCQSLQRHLRWCTEFLFANP